jgi:hypothetical protein
MILGIPSSQRINPCSEFMGFDSCQILDRIPIELAQCEKALGGFGHPPLITGFGNPVGANRNKFYSIKKGKPRQGADQSSV